jgi:hypothetical protein
MSTPLAPMPGALPDDVTPVNASGAPSEYTTFVARAAMQAADPAFQPYGKREYAPKERGGATYGVSVGFEAHTDPAAGMTMANSRLFPAATNRSAPNFQAGMFDHN